jgi:hypothetical protein
MKIPDNIQIAGIDYTIKEVNHDTHELLAGSTIGHIYYDKQLIVLADYLPEQVKDVTFFHELLHGIFMTMKVEQKEIYVDEDFVDRVAFFLQQVCSQLIEHNKGK